MSAMGSIEMHAAHVVRPDRAGRKAVSIMELLHWAFARECASIDFDELANSSDGVVVGVDTIWRLMRNKELGCRVDGGGRSEPHPDADIVASAVANLPDACGGRRMAVTVAELARVDGAPDWMAHAKPTCQPVEWKNGKHGPHAKTEVLGKEVCVSRGRAKTFDRRWCPVHFSDTAREVAAAQRRYLDWWKALFELRSTFQIYGGLSAFDVTSAMPPRAPWKKTA